MEIERHESFTITLSTDEAWNFWQEVQELKAMTDPRDGGARLNTASGLVTLRKIADTFTERGYLMRSPGAVPVPPPLSEQERRDRLRPQDTRKWTD